MSALAAGDMQIADRRLFIVEGKGGHHRVAPAPNRFVNALGDYLHGERPDGVSTDRVFVALKGQRRGQPLSVEGLHAILADARRRPGVERATSNNCVISVYKAAGGGPALEAVWAQAGHLSIESNRVYLHLTKHWKAGPLVDIWPLFRIWSISGAIAGPSCLMPAEYRSLVTR